MNKTQLVDAVAEKLGSKKAAGEAVDALVATISDTVAKGEKVAITGFGTFESAERPARDGFNHLTKTPFSVPATTVPKFRAGDTFKAAVAAAARPAA